MKAVVTAKDIVDFPLDDVGDARHAGHALMCRNVMAREKVLYEGHAVAAVAAINEEIAAAGAAS